MYTANDVRNIRFSKQMNGYKQEEVDVFLDGVETDYQQYESKISELNALVTKLKKENEELTISQSGLQNVLVSAQKLADQIVEDAKQRAEEIIVEAKVRSNEIVESTKEQIAADVLTAEQNKQRADAEYNEVMKKTADKSAEMITAAHDSVARQQLLFDKLKLDIVNFKSQVMSIYKEHIDILSKLPDEVPFDSARAAEAAAFAFDSKPDFLAEAQEETPLMEESEEVIEEQNDEQETSNSDVAQQETEENSQMELAVEETEEDAIVEPQVNFGFKVQTDLADSEFNFDDDEEDDEDEEAPRGFFKRKDRR